MAEPEWSAGYRGLCLYVARCLQPAWEEPVMAPVSRSSQQMRAAIPTATLQVRSFFQLLPILPATAVLRCDLSTPMACSLQLVSFRRFWCCH